MVGDQVSPVLKGGVGAGMTMPPPRLRAVPRALLPTFFSTHLTLPSHPTSLPPAWGRTGCCIVAALRATPALWKESGYSTACRRAHLAVTFSSASGDRRMMSRSAVPVMWRPNMSQAGGLAEEWREEAMTPPLHLATFWVKAVAEEEMLFYASDACHSG